MEILFREYKVTYFVYFATLILASISAPLSALFIALLAILGVIGVVPAFTTLLTLLLIRSVSPGLSSAPAELSAVIWLVLILFTLFGLLKKGAITLLFRDRIFLSLLVFVAISAVTSSVAGEYISLSLTKLAILALVLSLMLAIRATEFEVLNNRLRGPLLAFWRVTLFASCITVAMPDISYARDGVGFQGILNHPQAYAVVVSPFAAYTLVKWMGQGRPIDMLVLICAAGTLILTQARTGIISLACGVTFTLLAALFVRRPYYNNETARPGLEFNNVKPRFVIIIVLVLFAMVISGWETYGGFFRKATESDSILVIFEESRGFLMRQALENFLMHPFAGIGFGVANSETHEFVVEYFGFFPLAAPTEKAMLPLAVLEEVGIFGFMSFSYVIALLFLQILRSEDFAWIAAAVTALMTTLTEMTIFSMGGYGLYIWIVLIAACHAAPLKVIRLKTEVHGS
jgi:hypothetical protein